jgi:hypothetical protein
MAGRIFVEFIFEIMPFQSNQNSTRISGTWDTNKL